MERSQSSVVTAEQFAREAPRAGVVAATGLLVLAALLGGCVDTEREQYFGARQRVISVDAGDSSTIVSPVRSRQSVARAPELWP